MKEIPTKYFTYGIQVPNALSTFCDGNRLTQYLLFFFSNGASTYLARAANEWLKDLDPRKSKVDTNTSIFSGWYAELSVEDTTTSNQEGFQ